MAVKGDSFWRAEAVTSSPTRLPVVVSCVVLLIDRPSWLSRNIPWLPVERPSSETGWCQSQPHLHYVSHIFTCSAEPVSQCTLIVLSLTFKGPPWNLYDSETESSEILLQKKRFTYIKRICWILLPGFTLPLCLAGYSYLCVWSTLFTWNKATKQQWCSRCLLISTSRSWRRAAFFPPHVRKWIIHS